MYNDPEELMKNKQRLHLRYFLAFDDDGTDEDEQNDIEISGMNKAIENKDYRMGGSEMLQTKHYNDNFFLFEGNALWTNHPWNSQSMRKVGRAVTTKWRRDRSQ